MSDLNRRINERAYGHPSDSLFERDPEEWLRVKRKRRRRKAKRKPPDKTWSKAKAHFASTRTTVVENKRSRKHRRREEKLGVPNAQASRT